MSSLFDVFRRPEARNVTSSSTERRFPESALIKVLEISGLGDELAEGTVLLRRDRDGVFCYLGFVTDSDNIRAQTVVNVLSKYEFSTSTSERVKVNLDTGSPVIDYFPVVKFYLPNLEGLFDKRGFSNDFITKRIGNELGAALSATRPPAQTKAPSPSLVAGS